MREKLGHRGVHRYLLAIVPTPSLRFAPGSSVVRTCRYIPEAVLGAHCHEEAMLVLDDLGFEKSTPSVVGKGIGYV